jgi:hypothetical protein
MGDVLALGALLALVDGLAVVGIGVLVLPVLRQVSDPLAFGTSACESPNSPRFCSTLRALSASALAGAVTDGSLDVSAVQGLRPAVVAAHDMALQLIYLLNGIAGSLLAVLFYRSRLTPRAIAVLGLIGYPVLLVGTILAIFHVTDVTQGGGLLAVVPGALFELVLPIWLITRGFGGMVVADEPSESWSGPEPQLLMT